MAELLHIYYRSIIDRLCHVGYVTNNESLGCFEMIFIDNWIHVTLVAEPIQNFLKFVFAHFIYALI